MSRPYVWPTTRAAAPLPPIQWAPPARIELPKGEATELFGADALRQWKLAVALQEARP